MGWFFGRRKPQGVQPSSLELEDGHHPSPGLELLWTTLRQSPPRAILDLGASSTENLRFLSTFTDDLAIIDLFRGAREAEGARAAVFSFEPEVVESLPEGGNRFDVVLLWDLLHYFDRATFHTFQERLVSLCHSRTLVHLLAANHAEVPLTPIRFKLDATDSLCYAVPEGERAPGARLTTREVEIRLSQFTPWRLFQLRNGLQEFLFRFEPDEETLRLIEAKTHGEPAPAGTSGRPEESAAAESIVATVPAEAVGTNTIAEETSAPNPATEREVPEPVATDPVAPDPVATDPVASVAEAFSELPAPASASAAPEAEQVSDKSAPPAETEPDAEVELTAPDAEAELEAGTESNAETAPAAETSAAKNREQPYSHPRRRRRKRVKGRGGR